MHRIPQYTDHEIIAARPPKNRVEPRRPYAYFVEPERSAQGNVDPVATIFLTNRECPLRCLMCDLWQNTTDDSVPIGAIPEQIDYALSQLAPARHIKLYNSGNFFDAKAIPREDLPAVAARVANYETVIVENHPKLCSQDCLRFRDLLGGQLEIAMGLETVHPQVLPALNKRMTLSDFERAVQFLLREEISVRAFILLRPPYLSEEEGLEWAERSVEWAFSVGVRCCAVIPTRVGRGLMQQLAQRGEFAPPRLSSLEQVLEAGIRLGKGRVFADLWDLEQFASCTECLGARTDRLRQMNYEQRVLEPVRCSCEAA